MMYWQYIYIYIYIYIDTSLSRGSLRVGERRFGKKICYGERRTVVHLSSGDRIKIARESIIGVKSKETSEEYEFPPEEKEEEEEEEEKNERNVAAS